MPSARDARARLSKGAHVLAPKLQGIGGAEGDEEGSCAQRPLSRAREWQDKREKARTRSSTTACSGPTLLAKRCGLPRRASSPKAPAACQTAASDFSSCHSTTKKFSRVSPFCRASSSHFRCETRILSLPRRLASANHRIRPRANRRHPNSRCIGTSLHEPRSTTWPRQQLAHEGRCSRPGRHGPLFVCYRFATSLRHLGGVANLSRWESQPRQSLRRSRRPQLLRWRAASA